MQNLIPLLQNIQKQYRYLPKNVLRKVGEEQNILPADIYSVATFYDQFRLEPVGEHIISVCTGTACHVKGADKVLATFLQQLNIPDGGDTSPDKKFTIQKVACLGCCTLAPVVQIDGQTYGHLTAAKVKVLLENVNLKAASGQKTEARTKIINRPPAAVRIGIGSCCQAQGSAVLKDEVQRIINKYQLDVQVEGTGCVGMCHQTPLLEIVKSVISSGAEYPNEISRYYCHVQPEDVEYILLQHFQPKKFWQRWSTKVDRLFTYIADDTSSAVMSGDAFIRSQVRRATKFAGELDPLSIDDYIAHGGFKALKIAAQMKPEDIINAVGKSGLRGRGGAGFPTAVKWNAVRKSKDVCIICNGDEGDPGAFMDRMLLESFPYRVIEGMYIAALAVGAAQGIFYIRAEYPLAVQRVQRAIDETAKSGIAECSRLVLSVFQGAGAFVCGEETALLESIEGRRGNPRLKPPYPAQSGLFGQPTLINNVETLVNVPAAIYDEQFLEKSAKADTKVFALAGKMPRGGLIEVPIGITLREIVELAGGGSRVKAVQIGGPSGGCVPAELFDTPVDYESLQQVGAIMGSGGLIVLDETDCMVDIARYFLQFTQEQSCGKCTFCRIGTRRMLDILDRLCEGGGQPDDLEKLETLAKQVQAGSLCGLGKTAPNPVLSTLRYFRKEYEAHIAGSNRLLSGAHCPAGKCKAFIRYEITDLCNGCLLCVQACPVSAIEPLPYRKHLIDTNKCTKCDACRSTCPIGAVSISPAWVPLNNKTNVMPQQ